MGEMREDLPGSIGIVMAEVPSCGVAAFAARSFSPGEVVLQERALVASTVAAQDGGQNRNLWQFLVRQECSRRLSAFEPSGHLGAICALRDLGVAGCRQRLLTKCIGPEELLPSKVEARREVAVLKAAVREGYLPQAMAGFPADDYARLRRVFQLNGFRFNGALQKDQSGYDVGEVLFDNVSRINHSCEPNLSFDLQIDEERSCVEIRVRATAHLQEGDEVNIAYLPVALPCAERRRQLREHWLFECTCRRCQTEQEREASPPGEAADRSEADRGEPPRTRTPSKSRSEASSEGVCWDDLQDPDEASEAPTAGVTGIGVALQAATLQKAF